MPPWNIEQTRELIESYYGYNQLQLARPSMRAAYVRLQHARYHLEEVKKLLKTHIDDRLETTDIIMLTMPQDLNAWSEVSNWLMKVEAQMIACAQSIHAIPDTLAHVIYFALGLNLDPNSLKERNINVQNIAKTLAKLGSNYAEIRRTLCSLDEDPSFTRLDAFTNHAKHRGMPEPILSILFNDPNIPYEMQFGEFAYDGEKHSQRELEEVLAPAYQAASTTVVAVGNAINSVMPMHAPHMKAQE
jgi:hypothetical protein